MKSKNYFSPSYLGAIIFAFYSALLLFFRGITDLGICLICLADWAITGFLIAVLVKRQVEQLAIVRPAMSNDLIDAINSNTPPSIGFSVNNKKFQGKVAIVYDRGSDTYSLWLYPATDDQPTDNQPVEVDNIYFDELGLRLSEALDDFAWQVIRVKVL